jgi:hypothetical protein
VVVGLYACLVLVTELPGVASIVVVAAVLVLDGHLLRLVARRRSRAAAVWCAAVALLSAAMQAVWVWISFAGMLSPESDGVAWFGLGPALAATVGLVLLARRRSRPWGWAVLMGSAQGFVSSFLVLLAALMAAIGAD